MGTAKKCRVCGKPTSGQEKLCADCGKALRRVRQGTAALRNLRRYSVSADAPGPGVASAADSDAQGLLAGRRRPIAVAAVGAIAIAFVYFGLRTPDYGRSPSPIGSERSSAKAPAPTQFEPAMHVSPSDALESPAPSAAMESSVVPRSGETGVPATQAPSSPASALAAARAKTDPRGVTAAANATSNRGATLSRQRVAGDASSRSSNGANSADSEVASEGMHPVAAPDNAQLLASALEKCYGERFLSAVVCEQKVRLKFCEGKWGQIPQCTAKQRVD
jgi:hypothetical protein